MKRTLLWKLNGEKTRQLDINRPCQNSRMKSPFTVEEIQGVIKELPNGQSCGLDGICYEDVKSEYGKHEIDINSCFNA